MAAPSHRGLRHVALRVRDLSHSRQFYQALLGMQVVWEPDPDNVYLSSGSDNLALHQIARDELPSFRPSATQLLDHMGIIVESPEAVDQMYENVVRRIEALGGAIVNPPRRHRDGSYSFYFSDPDGIVIQALYEPTISKLEWVKGEA